MQFLAIAIAGFDVHLLIKFDILLKRYQVDEFYNLEKRGWSLKRGEGRKHTLPTHF